MADHIFCISKYIPYFTITIEIYKINSQLSLIESELLNSGHGKFTLQISNQFFLIVTKSQSHKLDSQPTT